MFFVICWFLLCLVCAPLCLEGRFYKSRNCSQLRSYANVCKARGCSQCRVECHRELSHEWLNNSYPPRMRADSNWRMRICWGSFCCLTSSCASKGTSGSYYMNIITPFSPLNTQPRNPPSSQNICQHEDSFLAFQVSERKEWRDITVNKQTLDPLLVPFPMLPYFGCFLLIISIL